RVVGRVLDIFSEDVEPVDLSGKARGDRGNRLVGLFGNLTGRTGGVDGIDGAEAIGRDELAALAKSNRKGLYRLDVLKARARHTKKRHLNPEIGLPYNMESAFGQQVVDIGDAPIERVFHRDHGKIGLARLHGIEGFLKGNTAHDFLAGEDIGSCSMAEGAGFALEGNSLGHGESPLETGPRVLTRGRS